MEDTSEPSPGQAQVAASDVPASTGSLLPRAGSLHLRPLWVGFALTVGGFFLFALAARYGANDDESRSFLAQVFSLPAFVYYFMIVHRVVKILDAEPGWSVRYTPAAAVLKHFIPFYGLYFLYRWPADVELYVGWRMRRRSRFAIWTFLGLGAGILLRLFDSYAGLVVMMTSLLLIYVPLRRALGPGSAGEVSTAIDNGILGLG